MEIPQKPVAQPAKQNDAKVEELQQNDAEKCNTIASMRLNRDEQKKFIDARKKLPIPIKILKYFTILITVFAVSSYFLLQADLNPKNRWFSIFGSPENTGMKFDDISKKHKKLIQDNSTVSSRIAELKFKMENNDYFSHSKTLEEIRENQLRWIDEIDPKTQKIKLGILQSIEKMQNYFNSSKYSHFLLSDNLIEISNFSLDRKQVSFSLTGSNLLGKTFFLNLEFVDMINALPFFRDGKITNFSRNENEDGDYVMSSLIQLKIQKQNEIDPDDDKKEFVQFKEWIENKNIETPLQKSRPVPRVKILEK